MKAKLKSLLIKELSQTLKKVEDLEKIKFYETDYRGRLINNEKRKVMNGKLYHIREIIGLEEEVERLEKKKLADKRREV